MATTPKNRIVRTENQSSLFEDAKPVISTAVSFNQGDLLYLDTSAHLIKAVTSNANCATLVGISRDTIVLGVRKSPYSTDVDASTAITDIAGPVFGVDAKMILKTGDAFNPGDKVFFTTDAQTVTSTAPGSPACVGIYVGATVASAAAGQEGLIRIGCAYLAGANQVQI